MPTPPTEWLQEAADGRLKLTGANVWKAMRYRGHIHVLDSKGQVMDHVTKLDECRSFKVTERGLALLEGSKKKIELPFSKLDLPRDYEMWLSSLRRCLRNIPKDFKLSVLDDELHVLAVDKAGNVANDGPHRIDSFKVPWHESK